MKRIFKAFCDAKRRVSVCWLCWDRSARTRKQKHKSKAEFQPLPPASRGVTVLTLAVKCAALCSLLTEHLECINSSHDSSSVWRAPLSSITLTMTQNRRGIKYEGSVLFHSVWPRDSCPHTLGSFKCLLKPPKREVYGQNWSLCHQMTEVTELNQTPAQASPSYRGNPPDISNTTWILWILESLNVVLNRVNGRNLTEGFVSLAGGSSASWRLGWEAEGSRFEPQSGQNLEGVLVVAEGATTPSEHYRGTFQQGSKLTNAYIGPLIQGWTCLQPKFAPTPTPRERKGDICVWYLTPLKQTAIFSLRFWKTL